MKTENGNLCKDKKAEWTEEEKQNVVGVFQILLDVDRRINPHLYKKKYDKINNTL